MVCSKTNILSPNNFFSHLLILASLFLSITMTGQQNGPHCPSGVCIGPGTSFSDGDLTITTNAFYTDLTMKNNKHLIIKSGYTLYIGQSSTTATTQVVDFQNG